MEKKGEFFVKITMIGFMATGKSTVGKILSQRLKIAFFDIDSIIRKKKDISIQKIFKNYGEEYFRSMESNILGNLITGKSKNDDMVISPGGGVVLVEKNRKIIKKYTLPILLTASVSTIHRRIKIKDLPLIKEEKDISEQIKIFLKQRDSYYKQFENIVSTDNKSPDEVVDEIISRFIS